MKTLVRFNWLLPLVSGGIVIGCLLYCRVWWTPHPMSLTDPDCSIVCWMFCNTMSNFWLSLGILFSLVSIIGGAMMRFNVKSAMLVTIMGGVLIVPSGLINLIPIYIARKTL
jgi:hypothetical protein